MKAAFPDEQREAVGREESSPFHCIDGAFWEEG